MQIFCGFFCSREFSHRVKSISLAKFTAGEVQALQEGGNEVRIYKQPLAIRILGLFMFLKSAQVPAVGEGEILQQETSRISLSYATSSLLCHLLVCWAAAVLFLYCECFLQRARDLYFKDWDPARNPLPDNRQVSYQLYDVDL
jgi:hypothetical protein